MTESQSPKTVRISRQQTSVAAAALILSVITMGVLSYLSLTSVGIRLDLLKKIFSILNIISVGIIILIMILRKKIYFSKKIIEAGLDQDQIVIRWNTLDIVLMAMAEVIAVCGMVLSFLGMPFLRLFHFFVVSGLLMLILIPNQTRTENRLQALKDDSPRTIC